jgi:hypothetical protein
MLRFAPPNKPIMIAALGALLLAGAAAAAQSTKAQPRPPSPKAMGNVTSVEVQPPKTGAGSVACPEKLTVYGSITTDGPGDVQYTWVTSDGKSWPDSMIRFTSKGQEGVNTEWKVGKPGKTVHAWIRLKVLSPNRKLSPKVTFTLQCEAMKTRRK